MNRGSLNSLFSARESADLDIFAIRLSTMTDFSITRVAPTLTLAWRSSPSSSEEDEVGGEVLPSLNSLEQGRADSSSESVRREEDREGEEREALVGTPELALVLVREVPLR